MTREEYTKQLNNLMNDVIKGINCTDELKKLKNKRIYTLKEELEKLKNWSFQDEKIEDYYLNTAKYFTHSLSDDEFLQNYCSLKLIEVKTRIEELIKEYGEEAKIYTEANENELMYTIEVLLSEKEANKNIEERQKYLYKLNNDKRQDRIKSLEAELKNLQ